MKKVLMIIAIVAIIAIAGSLIYYFVFFKPGIERAEIRLREQKAIEEVIRKENLGKCLEEAKKNYLEMILAIGKDTKPIELYKTQMDIAKELYQKDIDACNMMYGK